MAFFFFFHMNPSYVIMKPRTGSSSKINSYQKGVSYLSRVNNLINAKDLLTLNLLTIFLRGLGTLLISYRVNISLKKRSYIFIIRIIFSVIKVFTFQARHINILLWTKSQFSFFPLAFYISLISAYNASWFYHFADAYIMLLSSVTLGVISLRMYFLVIFLLTCFFFFFWLFINIFFERFPIIHILKFYYCLFIQ